MKTIIWLGLFALLANDATAQRGGGSGHGGGPGHGGVGRPGISRSGVQRGAFRGGYVNRGVGFNRGLSAFPYGYGVGWFDDIGNFLPYDADADSGYPPQPNVVIVQQPPPPQVRIQQPPREVQATVRDYMPPAPRTTAPSDGELPIFGIVMKDGSTRSAIAVVVNDDVLKYTDSEERNHQVSLDDVDRDATRKLNRERNLSIWIP